MLRGGEAVPLELAAEQHLRCVDPTHRGRLEAPPPAVALVFPREYQLLWCRLRKTACLIPTRVGGLRCWRNAAGVALSFGFQLVLWLLLVALACSLLTAPVGSVATFRAQSQAHPLPSLRRCPGRRPSRRGH